MTREVRMKRVLIVEDDKDLRNLYSLMLETSGFEVLQAEDGLRGIEELRKGKLPDVVVLDWVMPKYDGSYLLSALHPEERDRIKIVLVSGYARDQLPVPSHAIFLRKPLLKKELIAACN
jgi:CheY-like chemotaxis protein